MKKSFTKLTVAFATLVALLFVGVMSNNHNNVSHAESRAQFSRVYRVAKSKLGSPYVYGAAGANAFDCSGFTSYIYRNSLGVNLPRTAQQQFHATRRVARRHLRRGDLVFIGSSRRHIYHVGMFIGRGKMIDAQNRGVIRERVHAPWWHVVAYGRVA